MVTSGTKNEAIDDLTPIQKFFTNTNIFLTGATGFLGILLLEKLLYSCPNISTIYLLMRNKKEKNVETRLEELFGDVVFSRLREQRPNFAEKIVAIEGDCEFPELGLSTQDKNRLKKEVDIVFHMAATVRFDEALKKASFINIRAVRDITRLAHQMPNLKSFVHVSTIYSNCLCNHIEEKFYPPTIDYSKLLRAMEALPDDISSSITPRLVGNFPNTYTFTKQIAEDVVRQEGKGLPIGIHRPSIVASPCREPVRGWMNNLYGPGGYTAAGGVGLVRVAEIGRDIGANIVPADMVVNSIAASAWDVAENFSGDTNQHDIPIYNFESSQAPRFTWDNYTQTCLRIGYSYSSVHAIWYTLHISCRTHLSYVIHSFLLHKIPAFFVDAIRLCLRKPPILLKAYKKIDKMGSVLLFFLKREWTFESGRVSRLKNKMSDGDRKIFFCDLKNFDWEEYLKYHIQGVRIYLMKDPLDTLPQGLKKMRRLYWIHQATKTVFVIISMWIVWYLISPIFNSRLL